MELLKVKEGRGGRKGKEKGSRRYISYCYYEPLNQTESIRQRGLMNLPIFLTCLEMLRWITREGCEVKKGTGVGGEMHLAWWVMLRWTGLSCLCYSLIHLYLTFLQRYESRIFFGGGVFFAGGAGRGWSRL